MHEPTPRALDPRAGRLLADPSRFGRPRGDEPTILVAHSAPMAALLRMVERLAPTARTTLVTGPSGSGKSAIAALAQRLGPARGGAQLTLGRDGDVEDASRLRAAAASPAPLTVMVPELTDLSPEVQIALLAATEAHEAAPPGEGVHVIAQTSADPDDSVDRGRLRADLFYRVSGVRYSVPPLDRRSDDIEDLAVAGLRTACRQLGTGEKTLTVAALEVLRARTWPGNVRQLHNVVARAAALTDDRAIGAQTMYEACEPERGDEGRGGMGTIARRRRTPGPGARGRVLAALDGVDGNKSAAAARLGISRRSLYRLLEQLGE